MSRAEAEQIMDALRLNAPATGPQNASYFPVSQSASSLLASTLIHKCGIPSVDQLVNGGLRKTQCLEIAGPPGSGKETLALEFIRSALGEGVEVLVLGKQSISACSSPPDRGQTVKIRCIRLHCETLLEKRPLRRYIM
jgi:predicted ATP-dependent serine protease